MNFDHDGHTLDSIKVCHPQDPEECCTDMMKLWLGGRGRQPVNWATLVAVLKNAGFTELAGQVEQLVPTLKDGGGEEEMRGVEGDRIKSTDPSRFTKHQSPSPLRGERRGESKIECQSHTSLRGMADKLTEAHYEGPLQRGEKGGEVERVGRDQDGGRNGGRECLIFRSCCSLM